MPETPGSGGERARLLWLIDSLGMGGAERLVPVFAGALDRQRFDLHVASLREAAWNPIAAALRDLAVPLTVLRARNLRDLRGFRRLLGFLREGRFDVVHAHLTYAEIWGRLACTWTGIPVVSTLHVPAHFNYRDPGPRDDLVDGIAAFTRQNFGGPSVCVSDWLRRVHVSRGLSPDRVVVIPNGIDLGAFAIPPGYSREARRADLGLPPSAPVVAHLSVLREGKGLQTYIDAAALVLPRHPEARFLVIGGGPLEDPLREQVRGRGLADRILFTGMREDRAELLGLCDLCVLASEEDPLPGTVLEAMAIGLPFIGMKSGGVPEMVVPGETGLLVDPPGAEGLAEAMDRILSDPEGARQMGTRGRARVETEFRAEVWAGRLEALYSRVIAGHAARPCHPFGRAAIG